MRLLNFHILFIFSLNKNPIIFVLQLPFYAKYERLYSLFDDTFIFIPLLSTSGFGRGRKMESEMAHKIRKIFMNRTTMFLRLLNAKHRQNLLFVLEDFFHFFFNSLVLI
jgi:hypothetical protein